MPDAAPSSPSLPGPQVEASAEASGTSTVGGAQAAAAADASIDAATFEAWLVKLSPAQLRTVLAMFVAAFDVAALPAAFQARAIEVAPQAAQLAASGALEAYANGEPPPLVQLPDGRIFYSAGGEQYRQVLDDASFASLGLALPGVQQVATLGLPQAAPWPQPVSPAAAFTAAGAIIAGRGSVGAAYSFASLWRTRLA